ncbi:hypothetical protein, partial [Pseudomonas aeruginosa]
TSGCKQSDGSPTHKTLILAIMTILKPRGGPMRSPDIKVVKLEGDAVPWSIRDAGHEVCFVVMHGLTLRSDFLYSEEEAEAVADAAHQEIIAEMSSMLESARRR